MTDLFGASDDDDDAAPAAAAAPAGDRNKHRMEDLFGDDSDDEEAAPGGEAEFAEDAPGLVAAARPAAPAKRAPRKGTRPESLTLAAGARPPVGAPASVVRVPKFLALEHEPRVRPSLFFSSRALRSTSFRRIL